MTACPSWCRSGHEHGSSHQRHWLLGEPATVSLVLDDQTVAGIPGWDAPRIIISAGAGWKFGGGSSALLPLGTAGDLAGVFGYLGHAGLATAIGQAVRTGREAAP